MESLGPAVQAVTAGGRIGRELITAAVELQAAVAYPVCVTPERRAQIIGIVEIGPIVRVRQHHVQAPAADRHQNRRQCRAAIGDRHLEAVAGAQRDRPQRGLGKHLQHKVTIRRDTGSR